MTNKKKLNKIVKRNIKFLLKEQEEKDQIKWQKSIIRDEYVTFK